VPKEAFLILGTEQKGAAGEGIKKAVFCGFSRGGVVGVPKTK